MSDPARTFSEEVRESLKTMLSGYEQGDNARAIIAKLRNYFNIHIKCETLYTWKETLAAQQRYHIPLSVVLKDFHQEGYASEYIEKSRVKVLPAREKAQPLDSIPKKNILTKDELLIALKKGEISLKFANFLFDNLD